MCPFQKINLAALMLVDQRVCLCVCKTPQTVALEELNTEYIALKREQTRRDDLSTVLTSLRTRYDDIRAKVGYHSAEVLQFDLSYTML